MDGSGVAPRIDGVVIGVLVEVADGRCRVSAPLIGPDPLFARSLAPLDATHVGSEVALMFEGGSPERPLVLGKLAETGGAVVIADGARLRVTATERIELRCGKASIVMEADGHITIRGSYLVSHASAANRIRGGSVNLN